jgi:quinol monooxygenase YgiN
VRVHSSTADSNVWMIYEDWASQAAFDFHMQAPYVRGFLNDLRDP